MLPATALALLNKQDVLNRRLLFKTKPVQYQRKPSPTIFVSGIGQKKLSMQPKFVAAQKMLLKQKPSKHSVKWIARFYYFSIYTSAGSVCIAHNNYMSCPLIWQLYLHCSLIYFWVPSSCFCIVISLSEGEIIPFSGVCQSGGGCIIHAGGGGGFTHSIDRLLWCATDDDQRQHHHGEASFSL